MSNFSRYLSKNWLDDPKSNILSGLVVAFAMIPEAIAFSGIAGVDPKVGLFGAFCLSITIAIVGGRRGMITSATGSTTNPERIFDFGSSNQFLDKYLEKI